MTLEEAIKYAEEVVEENNKRAEHIRDKMKSEIALSNATECETCAKEHRQLSEWLKELQAHREAWENVEKELKKENQRFTNKTNFASGYIEGIREALFKIHEHRPKEEDNE